MTEFLRLFAGWLDAALHLDRFQFGLMSRDRQQVKLFRFQKEESSQVQARSPRAFFVNIIIVNEIRFQFCIGGNLKSNRSRDHLWRWLTKSISIWLNDFVSSSRSNEFIFREENTTVHVSHMFQFRFLLRQERKNFPSSFSILHLRSLPEQKV